MPRSPTAMCGSTCARTCNGWRTNLIGALRRAMATTGYLDVKEFQRVEVVVAPYQQT